MKEELYEGNMDEYSYSSWYTCLKFSKKTHVVNQFSK